MPFVQRTVQPRHLSRTTLFGEDGKAIVADEELQAVTNNTLSNALRQLASLALVADDIFTELSAELQKVCSRSDALKKKIGIVQKKVEEYDPKKVTVPEGDLSSFALLRDHYTNQQNVDTGLFGAETRPAALRALYEAAARTPVHTMRQMDRWRRDGHRSSRFFLCTPVLGAKRRRIKSKVDIDIETRMPAAVEELRRWTSAEALGNITVTPDCVNRIAPNMTAMDYDSTDYGATSGDDEGIDHKLPSPEEQLQVIALKFPAEIVAVDVSGRRFDRMLVQRRSMLHSEIIFDEGSTESGTVRRRTRSRKPRGKRRNTLAGTDQKEIRDALTAREEDGESSIIPGEPESPDSGAVVRSRSSDILRSKKSPPSDTKKSHFNSLKQWGKSRLRLMNRSAEAKEAAKAAKEIDDSNLYETVTMRRRRSDKDKDKASCSSSDKSSSASLGALPAPLAGLAVKLRESASQRRRGRAALTNGSVAVTAITKEDQHSSSGNWSASSESGRASIGSEPQPRSTTSAATSSNSLNGAPGSAPSRRRFPHPISASSSATSEGTLTPDPAHEGRDEDTSSAYSCDTEGYYTSFHVDSGLKTLREEETSGTGLPATPLHCCAALSADSEYELFGRGSTSTTTSSAGTVCTTLMAADSSRSLSAGPAVPERISSLDRSASSSLEREYGSDRTGTVKRSPAARDPSTRVLVSAEVHGINSGGDVSPDSGHNTSSSPIESVSSPTGVRSGSEFEFSESSDLEGVERTERIRVKTAINSSRIPSMCVITPPHSDDEAPVSVPEYAVPRKNKFNLKNVIKGKQYVETEARIVSSRTHGSDGRLHLINVNPTSGYATVETVNEPQTEAKMEPSGRSVRAPSPSGGTVTVISETPAPIAKPSPPSLKATLMPLNTMFGRLRTNISNLTARKERSPIKPLPTDDALFDSGDYVTIADVRNNNEKAPIKTATEITTPASPPGTTAEYVSLDVLISEERGTNVGTGSSDSGSLERGRRQGARVTLDAEGKVVYSSDSLRRRKGAHTTFEPGPFVKEPAPEADAAGHRETRSVRPAVPRQATPSGDAARPLSPQLNKVVIRANPKTAPVQECVRMRPARVVGPCVASPKLPGARGAYVNMQEERRPADAVSDEEQALLSSNYQRIQQAVPNIHARIPQQLNDSTMMQRATPMYRTLPNRRTPNGWPLEEIRYNPRQLPSQQMYNVMEQDNRQSYYGFNSLPRRTYSPQHNANYPYQNVNPVCFNTGNYVQENQVPFSSRTSTSHIQSSPLKSSTPNKPQSPPNRPFANFFSPIRKNQEYNQKLAEHLEDSLKISPIDPRNSLGFQSSTPSKPKEDLQYAVNLSNKLLSPKKSTMSNEELYAMIHKSKKKMNIRTDDLNTESPTLSPASSIASLPARITPVKQPESGYLGDARTRSSWSPNTDDAKLSERHNRACSDRMGSKATSRLDFKKLLLQQNTKTSPLANIGTKLSAVEQLKLSKNQPIVKSPPPMNIMDLSASPKNLINRKFIGSSPGSPKNGPDKQRTASKLLSPRSNWRFANPRTDILSSTILEDCREDESSGSSMEKNKSSPRVQDNKSPGQNSVTFSNAGNVTDVQKAGIRRQLIPNEYNFNDKLQNMSRSQYIQAQRAQFFNSSPVASGTISPNAKSISPNPDNRHKMSSSTTLETAL